MIRQPIITILGHVDHGKTSLLDYIRGSSVAAREAGGITQHVGATVVPIRTIQDVCKKISSLFKMEMKIPGLLFIDTPGHEIFTNLRKRGGSIADLAVLVVDINQGVQPQTKEAVEILKSFKVPFVVAANKIDMISGWKTNSLIFTENLKTQIKQVQDDFEKKFYTLLGQISELGFNCNLYTQVADYQKELVVIPVSARTGEGVAELLAMLAGLSQKFMAEKLEIDETSGAKGTILEIKEEKGMGTVADVIIYEGVLTNKDSLLIGGVDDVVCTKVRGLFEPAALQEIREKNTKFKQVDKVCAAAGIRIVATGLDKAAAGAPIFSARNEEEIKAAREKLILDVQSVLITTDDEGIVLRCDTLGSLEAVTKMIQSRGVPIRFAGLGPVNKKDVLQASSVTDPANTFVLGFNVTIQDGAEKLAKEKDVAVLTDSIIYKLLERFEETVKKRKELLELKKLEGLVWPARFRILPGYIFRQSNPAVFGVEILAGKLKPGVTIMSADGKELGEIKNIESEGVKQESAAQGEKVALSVKGLTLGRQAKESDELFVSISERDYRQFKEKKELLNKAEIEVLKQVANVMRKTKDTWGV